MTGAAPDVSSRGRLLPLSLRTRLFVAVAAGVAVSIGVMLVIGAILMRRSLESDALRSLERQVELLAAQRTAGWTSARSGTLGEFLATEQVRLAVLTPAQAELLLPDDGARDLAASGEADGKVSIRGDEFLYSARLAENRALVLLRSAQSQRADWNPFLVGLALAGAVGAALAALIALVLSRAIVRPISRVALAARRLAAGADPAPLPETGPPETAALACSFNHLSRQLQHAREAERAFLLSVSHELKTPLTAIRGHAEAIADGVMPTSRAVEVIEREARRLERLITDLLDLGRLRRHSFTVEIRDLDLSQIAAEAVERHAARAREYDVSLEAEPSKHPCHALGDPDRVLQAVSNLVENAVRCTPDGGHVRLRVAPGRVDVVDDGPGLEPDDLAQAFERFHLYERYGADRPVGTGLGLAVVQELAQAMGGFAAVASTPGEGSTFSLLLPTRP